MSKALETHDMAVFYDLETLGLPLLMNVTESHIIDSYLSRTFSRIVLPLSLRLVRIPGDLPARKMQVNPELQLDRRRYFK